MRRILLYTIIAAILLGACSPVVTLLTHEPDPVLTPASQPEPTRAAANEVPAPAPTAFPSPTPGLGASPDALKGVEVVAWHGWDGNSASLFAQMAAEFNGINPWGIQVKVVSKNNLTALKTDLTQALNTPESPDIVVALPEHLLGWHAALSDLSLYISNSKLGLEPDALLSALMQQSNLDGGQYGIPALRSGRYLFYNVSWARELGFSAPPQSWDDFHEQACAANAFWKSDQDETNDGYGGLALDVEPNWQTPFAWLGSLGGQVFADGAFAFETEKNIAALQKLSDLRAEGCAWLPEGPSSAESFAARRALFVTGSLGDLAGQRSALSEAVSTDEWTLIAFPGERAVVPVYGPDYAVLKSNQSRQLAAWLFIRWMIQPENQARWARRTGLLPVSDAALKLLQSDLAANSQKGAAAKLLSSAEIYPRSAQWELANKILADGFLYMFQAFPAAAPASILAQMDATVQELGH